MKEPKLSNLKIDESGTRSVRREAGTTKPVKITINIDAESLRILRAKSAKTGVPYQRLLNRLLREALRAETKNEPRLDRLEKQIAILKRKIVARS